MSVENIKTSDKINPMAKENDSIVKTAEFDFNDKNVIAQLIKNQRIPNVMEMLPQKPVIFWEPFYKDALILVPPEGTRIGDKIIGSPAFGVRFVSPEGNLRGYADFHSFNGDLHKLEKRIADEVKKNYPEYIKNKIHLYEPSTGHF